MSGEIMARNKSKSAQGPSLPYIKDKSENK
jgi:hypothetical protein